MSAAEAVIVEHPALVPLDPDGIPNELKQRRQWVVTRLRWVPDSKKGGEKLEKPPLMVDGRNASTTDPKTWTDFATALAAVQSGKFDALGFVFTSTDCYVGVDIDGCRNPETGVISRRAEGIVTMLASYTEISVSGKGLHVIVGGMLPSGRRKLNDKDNKHAAIEMYNEGRYFVLTGQRLENTAVEVWQRQEQIDALHAQLFPEKKPEKTSTPPPHANGARSLDDDALLDLARNSLKNGAKFRSLFDAGDTSAYSNDDSAADQALANHLAFWTDRDPARTDRLFRRSALMRLKWDSKRGTGTYGSVTVDKACERAEGYMGASANGTKRATEKKSSAGTSAPKADAPKAAGIAARIEEANDHFAQDEGGKLYVYLNGVYRPTGEQHVRARVKKLVPGEQWTNHLANETVEYLRVDSPALWEQPPLDVISVANGLLDVHKRELTPFSPKHLTTAQLPVTYDPDATCPAWDKQIEETFPTDAVLSGLAWQTVAWLMVPFTSLQKALLLLGPGGTGKSTFLTALFAFLGRYRNVASMTLQRLENDRFGTSRLVGKLANICADLPSTHLETSSVFKAITGGDPLPAEYKFRDSFDFIPFARLIFSANQPPRSKDATDAFFQRWWVVPFENVKRGTAQEISRRELDAKLAAPAELSGVLNRALDYLPDVLNHGLTVTESMRKAHEEFQKTTDPLSIWLDKNTIESPEALVPRAELLAAYNADADREGRTGMTQTAFGLALKQLRHVTDTQRSVGGRLRTWCYLGIGLKARESTQSREDAPDNAA